MSGAQLRPRAELLALLDERVSATMSSGHDSDVPLISLLSEAAERIRAAPPLVPKDPIMNQEREAVARIILGRVPQTCGNRCEAEITTADERENALAAADEIILALRSGGEGWRPIESAPKDGTYILVTEGGIAPQFVVCWQRYDGSPNGGYWHPRCGIPVYWHALPASPSTHGEG